MLDCGVVAGVCGAGGWVAGCWPAGNESCVGCEVAGVEAGAGFGAGLENFSSTEPPCSTALSVRSTRAMEQSMNMIAHHVVALDSTLAAPRGPKAV